MPIEAAHRGWKSRERRQSQRLGAIDRNGASTVTDNDTIAPLNRRSTRAEIMIPRHALAIGGGKRGLGLFRACPQSGRGTGKTFTFNLVDDFGADPTGKDVAATTTALRDFNIEAQRLTRPAEAGIYEGGHNNEGNAYPGADIDHVIVLKVPVGTFRHSWNRFPLNIRRFKMIGAGSGQTFFQNIGSRGSAGDGSAIRTAYDYFGIWFDDFPSKDFDGSHNLGYLIETAPAGATTVSLKKVYDPAVAGKFFVGRWLLICSYSQQQYGFPANMRYYDHAVVTACDPASGTISFDRPLQFEHRDDRPYWGNSLTSNPLGGTDGGHGWIGPARVMHIDHPHKPVGACHEYRGLAFLGNPNWLPEWEDPLHWDSFWANGLIEGLLEDVVIERALGHAMCKRLVCRGCAWSWDESDKIVEELVYENCDVAEASLHHAGQLSWQAIGGRIHSCSISCLEARLKHVRIDALEDAGDYRQGVGLNVPNATELVVIDGCTFSGRGHTLNQPISQATRLLSEPFTIGASAVERETPSRLRIRKGDHRFFSPSWQIVDNWCEGHTARKNGALVPGSAIARIWGDADHVYVEFAGVIFADGDTVDAARVQKLVVRNCTGINTGYGWSGPPWSNLADTIPEIIWTGNQGD